MVQDKPLGCGEHPCFGYGSEIVAKANWSAWQTQHSAKTKQRMLRELSWFQVMGPDERRAQYQTTRSGEDSREAVTVSERGKEWRS